MFRLASLRASLASSMGIEFQRAKMLLIYKKV
jgi:hypothetical protein